MSGLVVHSHHLEGTSRDGHGKGKRQGERQDDPGRVQAERQCQGTHPSLVAVGLLEISYPTRETARSPFISMAARYVEDNPERLKKASLLGL